MGIPIETLAPIVEPKSSVEVKRNSKGYNWSVKIYDEDADKAFKEMVRIEIECQEKYGEGI